jgi:hypothetical protein
VRRITLEPLLEWSMETHAGRPGCRHQSLFGRACSYENVRVLQPSDGLDLAPEAIGAENGGQLRMQNLERHMTAVLPVAREIHRGLPPRPSSRSTMYRSRNASNSLGSVPCIMSKWNQAFHECCADQVVQARYSRELMA